VEVPAHALSHRGRYRGCMIPLDLVFALTPSLLLAALWVADWIRGSWSLPRCARWWARCACVPDSGGWTANSCSSCSQRRAGALPGRLVV